jgi:peptidyl-prolyl cis-trans isomerase D
LEVVRWANDAKVGEVSDLIKLEDGYVVAVVTAIDDAEYKSLAKVSSQIKNTLLREKKAALLKEKMQGATLEEIAASANATIETFENAKTAASYVQNLGIEPRVVAQFAKVTEENKGNLLPLINGGRGVYAVVVDEVAVEEKQTLEAERVRVQAVEERKAANGILRALYEAANVVDNTVKYF